eukprot:TRINITY_DN7955_c0_g2_i1.p1 TRINITY_DN7955_c0_g2~~TRINITY_DN7955_c0_g2_i1.p1  ORF type:complete len:276 (+),score=42.42 TRINITY_DN7955_c0_g2_i1:34-828(+)
MSHHLPLEGKVAVITGAGSGIGAATAELFAKNGAHVVLVGRHAEKLEKILKGIEKEGGKGTIFEGDASEEEDVRKLYAKVKEECHRLDIIVANAGVNGVWAPISQLNVDEWDTTMKINLRGTFLTIKYGVELLKEGGSLGNIIVVSSINGTRIFVNTGASAYATSKAGQLALVKMLAPELAQDHIRINCVCPGAIDTDIGENTEHRNLDDIRLPIEYPQGYIPLTGKKPGESRDVAEAILYLANATHVTGTELYVDGGESLIGK